MGIVPRRPGRDAWARKAEMAPYGMGMGPAGFGGPDMEIMMARRMAFMEMMRMREMRMLAMGMGPGMMMPMGGGPRREMMRMRAACGGYPMMPGTGPGMGCPPMHPMAGMPAGRPMGMMPFGMQADGDDPEGECPGPMAGMPFGMPPGGFPPMMDPMMRGA